MTGAELSGAAGVAEGVPGRPPPPRYPFGRDRRVRPASARNRGAATRTAQPCDGPSTQAARDSVAIDTTVDATTELRASVVSSPYCPA